MQYRSAFSTTLFALLVAGLAFVLPATAVAEEDATAEEAQGATQYEIDAVHSSVVFRIKHLDVGYVFGMFRGFEGEFVFDEDNPEASSFNFTIDATSVFTNQQDRDDHLRSPDFFAAEEHPEITFESTSVKHRGGETYDITGNLTMRGTTEEITMVADQTGTGTGREGEFRRGFMTTFAVNRLDFGVDFMPEGLGEYVRVMLAVQGVAQE